MIHECVWPWLDLDTETNIVKLKVNLKLPSYSYTSDFKLLTEEVYLDMGFIVDTLSK